MGGLTSTLPRRRTLCRARWLCTLVALALMGGCSTVPVAPAVSSVLALDGSTDHACVVTMVGDARCWGDNRFGQLGDGTTTDPPAGSTVRVKVSGLVDIAVGSEFTCGLERASTVVCWGFNLSGQLGDGTKDGISQTPVRVSGITDVVDVAAGGDHACAVRSDGHVSCWGANDFGQLGDGTRIARTRPVDVIGVDDAVQVSAGTGFTCTRRRRGEVACWGIDSLGQLGDEGFHDSPSPVPVAGLGRVATVDAGLDDVCAVVVGADVRCWGAGQTLRVDRGEVVGDRPLRQLPGTVAAVSVATGDRAVCALGGGRMTCWDTASGDRIKNVSSGSGSGLVALAVSDVCTASRGSDLTCRRLR